MKTHILVSIFLGFYSVIGLSVNFRRQDKHNPFLLSLWGYMLVAPCILLTLLSVYLQYDDYQNAKADQNKADQRIFRDSISQKQFLEEISSLRNKVLDQKQTIDNVYAQNKNLSTQNEGLHNDERDIFKQNVNLLNSAKYLQHEIIIKDKRIEYLEKSVSAAKQGNTKSIAYNGSIRKGGASQGGGFGTSISVGVEANYFPKLIEATKKGNPYLTIKICDEGIKLSPGWMTPYLLKGFVLYDIGLKEDGLSYLQTVEDNTIGDPDYTQKLINFYVSKNLKEKAKEIKATYGNFH